MENIYIYFLKHFFDNLSIRSGDLWPGLCMKCFRLNGVSIHLLAKFTGNQIMSIEFNDKVNLDGSEYFLLNIKYRP